jgi:hypothetical protein
MRDAINRAAFAIDGTTLPGVVQFQTKTAHHSAQRDQAAANSVDDHGRAPVASLARSKACGYHRLSPREWRNWKTRGT